MSGTGNNLDKSQDCIPMSDIDSIPPDSATGVPIGKPLVPPMIPKLDFSKLKNCNAGTKPAALPT